MLDFGKILESFHRAKYTIYKLELLSFHKSDLVIDKYIVFVCFHHKLYKSENKKVVEEQPESME